MIRKYAAVAAFLGLLTIIIGAFGAHALKEKLDPESFQSFETGVRYMMYHVLAILLINSSSLLGQKSKIRISQLFLLGILCFSGSIFAIAIDLVAAKSIWFVTPLGGLLFMAGWFIAIIALLKSNDEN